MAAATTRLATLGLAGDLDDLDMIRDVERTFGVAFGDDEVATWRTVGEIEAALAARFPASDAAGRCASAMVFYRLRAALERAGCDAERIRSRATLASLDLGAPRAVSAALGRDLGCDVPGVSLGMMGEIGWALLSVAVLGVVAAALFGGMILLAAGLAFGLGLVLLRRDNGSFGERTVADLVRDLADANYATLVAQGADRRPDSIWRVLRRVVSRQTCVDPASVGRETRLVG